MKIKKIYSLIILSVFVISCNSTSQNNKYIDISEDKYSDQESEIQKNTEPDYFGQKLPGNIPELFAPNIISTKVEHSAALFSTQNDEMWFARMYPLVLWVSKKTENGWSDPEVSKFSGDYTYGYPFLTPDGSRLYFTSDRPQKKGGDRLSRAAGQLWYAERQGDHWSDPIHLGDKMNVGAKNTIGSITENKTIYFTAAINNQPDIYCSICINGEYMDPYPIAELNTSSPEFSPYVSPDDSYMIFSSFRGGMGKSDLFISFNRDGEGWTPPINLGSTINSSGKDEYPYVTPDGKYFFFNSNRPSEINNSRIPDGPGNIYWMKADFIDEIKK